MGPVSCECFLSLYEIVVVVVVVVVVFVWDIGTFFMASRSYCCLCFFR